MTTAYKFTPIYPTNVDGGPMCSLLTINDINILLDIGWTYQFDLKLLEPLSNICPTVDVVLLSQPDIEHIGALVYAFKEFNLRAPVYCTTAVYHLGRLLFRDIVLSFAERRKFALFDIEDIVKCFTYQNEAKSLTFCGPTTFTLPRDKTKSVTLVPYRAGHLAGGALWKISSDMDEIIYATDCNNKSESHLDPGVVQNLPNDLKKPNLLILDAPSLSYRAADKKKSTEDLALVLKEVLGNGGNVLIPTDPCGRVLELATILDRMWDDVDLHRYPLIMLSPVSRDTRETAIILSDFVSTTSLKDGKNAFEFRNVVTANSIEYLSSSNINSPVCVLASDPTLEMGCSCDLFERWGENSFNTVIFTGRTIPGCAASLLTRWAQQNPSGVPDQQIIVSVPRYTFEPMSAAEREEVEKAEKAEAEAKKKKEQEKQERRNEMELEKEKEEEEETKEEPLTLAEDADDDMDADNEFGYRKEQLTTLTPAMRRALIDGEIFQNKYDATADEFKKCEVKFPMFPFQGQQKCAYDNYGLIVSLDRYKSKADEQITMEIEKQEEEIFPDKDLHKYENEVLEQRTVNTQCRLYYFDFEGHCDTEATKYFLSEMRPKFTLVIRTKEQEMVKRYYEEFKVQTPNTNEIYEFVSNKQMKQVSLSDDLRRVNFTEVQTYGVCPVSVEFEKKGDVEELVPQPPQPIVPNEPQSASSLIPQKSFIIGEIDPGDYFASLTDKERFKLEHGEIASKNKTAYFAKSRGEELNDILLEGALSDDYFELRKILYDKYLTM